MIYCVSDIHGRIDLFKKLLKKINFSENDFIYILGDCIDRGGGLSCLEMIMDMESKGKAKLIKGNHEADFVENIFSLDLGIANKIKNLDLLIHSHLKKFPKLEQYNALENLYKKFYNSAVAANNLSVSGAYTSCMDFWSYDEDKQNDIIKYLISAPVFIDVQIKNKNYRLLHAGCNEKGETDLYIRDDFFCNPNPILNKTLIFGHTSTKYIRVSTENTYKKQSIWYDMKNGIDKIGIDCDCSRFEGRLACIRLDDMSEYYIENENLLTYPVSSLNEFINDNEYCLSEIKYNIWNL